MSKSSAGRLVRFWGVNLLLDPATPEPPPFTGEPLLLKLRRLAPLPPPRYKPDDPTWVVVTLTPAGEAAVLKGLVEAKLRRELDLPEDFDVFVPALAGRKDASAVVLMPGYAFVRSGLPEVKYLALSKARCGFFSGAVHKVSRGLKVLLTVKNEKVQELKTKLLSLSSEMFTMGDEVKVVTGVLEGLVGKVVDRRDGEVALSFEFRSLSMIRYIPVEHLSREGS